MKEKMKSVKKYWTLLRLDDKIKCINMSKHTWHLATVSKSTVNSFEKPSAAENRTETKLRQFKLKWPTTRRHCTGATNINNNIIKLHKVNTSTEWLVIWMLYCWELKTDVKSSFHTWKTVSAHPFPVRSAVCLKVNKIRLLACYIWMQNISFYIQVLLFNRLAL